MRRDLVCNVGYSYLLEHVPYMMRAKWQSSLHSPPMTRDLQLLELEFSLSGHSDTP